MKKLICICMALVLALGSFCALAEEDLQAQLDAANAKIAELQAQVDTYYPYYAAQIVATYGADGVVWLEDVKAQVNMDAARDDVKFRMAADVIYSTGTDLPWSEEAQVEEILKSAATVSGEEE